MIITPMSWAEVPLGAIVLCEDGVQREIGARRARPGDAEGSVRRELGTDVETRPSSAVTLVVDYDSHVQGFNEAVVAFLRAGFTVEVIPS